ncbi:thioredoxin [Boudabousia marimammalium]|uniref:Thioredoxin n=1 Tax=Boudabousia marimammalium TaxID=156892 RepID=A0A1Q5PT65_9ACTO|nr:thioredoxin [Boudabousia marimammalium]OKL50570.1 thioredoxin [Boudabousia marimammalium]
MSAHAPKELTDRQFQANVRLDRGLMLVDFWAPWCAPCRQLSPVLDEIAEEMGDDLVIWKLNVDENPVSPAKYGIRAIPTMLIFLDGELVDTMHSAPKSEILETLRKHLPAN